MSIEISGFDDILKTIDELGEVGNKVGKKGVKKALEIALPIIKAEAPRDEDSSSHGADSLSIGSIKSYKSGSIWGGVGINSKNWDKTKHLYFHHYGYQHYKNGKFVQPHKGWMDEAMDKSMQKALSVLEGTLNDEISRILK